MLRNKRQLKVLKESYKIPRDFTWTHVSELDIETAVDDVCKNIEDLLFLLDDAGRYVKPMTKPQLLNIKTPKDMDFAEGDFEDAVITLEEFQEESKPLVKDLKRNLDILLNPHEWYDDVDDESLDEFVVTSRSAYYELQPALDYIEDILRYIDIVKYYYENDRSILSVTGSYSSTYETKQIKFADKFFDNFMLKYPEFDIVDKTEFRHFAYVGEVIYVAMLKFKQWAKTSRFKITV